MKHRAIVCNIGHFDSEIQIDALRNYNWDNVKPQVDEVVFPDGKRLIVLSRGPAGEPGQRDRPPELRDERELHQPGAGADRTVDRAGRHNRAEVYTLPKHLDEKVAALHLAKVGAKLTKLSPKQAEYIGAPRQRPVQARPLSLLSPRSDAGGRSRRRPRRIGRYPVRRSNAGDVTKTSRRLQSGAYPGRLKDDRRGRQGALPMPRAHSRIAPGDSDHDGH